MRDEHNTPLTAPLTDAEGLTKTPGGTSSLLVSFEQVNRIWAYDLDLSLSRNLGLGGSIVAACGGGNLGIEALTMLNASHLLAVCEESGGYRESRALLFDLSESSAAGLQTRRCPRGLLEP